MPRAIGVITFSRVFGFLLFAVAACAFGADQDAPRHALVIGNAGYEVSPLRNPRHDAADVADALREIDYVVSEHVDLDLAAFERTLEAFFAAVPGPDAVVVVFYAGHAVQLRGRNYLLPVDTHFDTVEDLLAASVPLQTVFDRLSELGSRENVIVLDACRDNPFASDEEEGDDDGLSGLPGGLAPVEAPPGTYVAYATEPGDFAADGRGRNGTYTRHLLRHLDAQEPIEEVFQRVRRGVVRETRGDQVPWEHSSLFEPLLLHPRQNARVPPVHAF